MKEVADLHGIPDQRDMFRDCEHIRFVSIKSRVPFPLTYSDDADLSQVLQLFVVPDSHNATRESIVPRIQFDTAEQ